MALSFFLATLAISMPYGYSDEHDTQVAEIEDDQFLHPYFDQFIDSILEKRIKLTQEMLELLESSKGMLIFHFSWFDYFYISLDFEESLDPEEEEFEDEEESRIKRSTFELGDDVQNPGIIPYVLHRQRARPELTYEDSKIFDTENKGIDEDEDEDDESEEEDEDLEEEETEVEEAFKSYADTFLKALDKRRANLLDQLKERGELLESEDDSGKSLFLFAKIELPHFLFRFGLALESRRRRRRAWRGYQRAPFQTVAIYTIYGSYWSFWWNETIVCSAKWKLEAKYPICTLVTRR